MAYKVKLLSIDGGGIRGLIPAKILAKLEDYTGKRICELFDFIAGTSTGGILALGLTKPDPNTPTKPHYKAEKLIEVYREDGERIFHESWLGRQTDMDEIFRPKFSSEGRDEVLTEYLEDTPMQRALTEVFITSYDIELRTPVFFTSEPKKDKTGGRVFRKICSGFTMKEAAMATSAAPTYFEPYHLRAGGHETPGGFYALVDGGVFANNPTMLAIMEAIIGFKKRGETLRLEDILVVSLGTGSLTRSYFYDEAKTWGRVGWIQPLINITLDGASESVACQLDQLLPNAEGEPKQYYRFQAFLSPSCEPMDSTDHTEELEDIVNKIIAQKEDDGDLDELCNQLLEASSS